MLGFCWSCAESNIYWYTANGNSSNDRCVIGNICDLEILSFETIRLEESAKFERRNVNHVDFSTRFLWCIFHAEAYISQRTKVSPFVQMKFQMISEKLMQSSWCAWHSNILLYSGFGSHLALIDAFNKISNSDISILLLPHSRQRTPKKWSNSDGPMIFHGC